MLKIGDVILYNDNDLVTAFCVVTGFVYKNRISLIEIMFLKPDLISKKILLPIDGIERDLKNTDNNIEVLWSLL